jgi:hypothetical protein
MLSFWLWKRYYKSSFCNASFPALFKTSMSAIVILIFYPPRHKARDVDLCIYSNTTPWHVLVE